MAFYVTKNRKIQILPAENLSICVSCIACLLPIVFCLTLCLLESADLYLQKEELPSIWMAAMAPKYVSKLFLLTAVIQWCFLLKPALSADPSQLVTGLPGQPQVRFKQYAGQVTLNATAGRALFYWFYEADHADAPSLPVVLWLNGGPGCSSIGAGALGELGPFRTNNNGGLTLNPYSWNKAANMIFLESPAGVGFSYTKTPPYYTDDETAADNLLFLVEWFKKFPEYSKNEFYVTGESYAGHYIPTLASHIVAYNAQGGSINFKGFAIGNPWTVAEDEDLGDLQFYYTHSLVSDEVYNEAMENCYSSNGNGLKCSDAQHKIRTMVEFVNPYNVYKQNCNPISFSNQSQALRYRELLRRAYDPCVNSVSPYLNSAKVQVALHVANSPASWHLCSILVQAEYSEDDVGASMLPLYEQLLKAGIRIWIYSGDFDSVVSTLSTRAWIKQLNLTVHTPWYAWNYQNQVGGWAQVYSGLTFTTVRGAGHMVPDDQPGPALAMFQSFLQGKSLPTF